MLLSECGRTSDFTSAPPTGFGRCDELRLMQFPNLCFVDLRRGEIAAGQIVVHREAPYDSSYALAA